MLYLAIAVGSAIAAGGQVLLKLGALGRTSIWGLVNGYVFAGLVLYGLALMLWLFAMTKLPLYVVYPFTLLTSGLVLIGAIVVLGERPSATALAGWAVVACGIGLIAYGSVTPAA